MSWEDQGRQEHGWFGSGTAPAKLRLLPNGTVFDRTELAQRVQSVAYGVIAALPRTLRGRAQAQYEAGNLARFIGAMSAWGNGTKLGEAEFAERFFGRDADDPIAAKLHEAALDVDLATSHADLRQASEKVAEAVQSIGLDRWPRFLADAQERASAPGTLTAIERSRRMGELKILDLLRTINPISAARAQTPPGPLLPGGVIKTPIDGSDPLDPKGLNKSPPSAPEQLALTATLNAIRQGVMASVRHHSYRNLPHDETGAVLPASNAGYTAYDVPGVGSGRGVARLLVDNATGAIYYTNNHYRSFFSITISPTP